MTEPYTPRLSIELTEDQYKKMQLYFPHGTKKVVFSLIIDQLISLIEKHGAGNVLGAFIEKQVEIDKLVCLQFRSK